MQRCALPVLFAAFSACAQVVITEINRDPLGCATCMPGDASHEFVEVTNFGTDTFSVDSLYLTDGVETDAVVPWPARIALNPDCVFGSRVLPPGRTALILDRNYDSALGIAPSSVYTIRPNTVLFTTGDNDLGNGLAGDDGVMIYKGTKSVVSRVVWCAADSPFTGGANPPAAKLVLSRSAPEGSSVFPTSFLFGPAVYNTCSDSVTPGFFELLTSTWFAEWRFTEPDTVHRTFACSLSCIKAGALPGEPLRWSMTVQSTSSGPAAAGVCTVTGNRASAVMTLPLDSAAYFLHLSEQGAPAPAVWQLDISQLYAPPSPVRINEVFPRATPGEPEWIELCNVSQMTISLKNWTFGNSESFDTVTAADVPLAPGGFIVLAADAALFKQRYPAKQTVLVPPHWHSLDNYNDTIRLWDAKHRLKETVCYQSAWFNGWKYQSLERTAPASPGTDRASWALSAASPTPGQPNDALYLGAASRPGLTIGPTPFTPNGDGRDDLLSITVEQGTASSASLTMYGFSGRRLRTFPGPLARQLLWDGRQDDGSPAPIGPFFAVLETHGAQGVSQVRKKGVLWR